MFIGANLIDSGNTTETDHPPQLKLVNKFGNLNSIKHMSMLGIP